MLKFEQKLSQKQVLSPQQILQARLLQLSTIKLEEKILNELEENPVLEQVESTNDKEQDLDEGVDDSLDLSSDDDAYEPVNFYDRSKKPLDLPVKEEQDFIETLLNQLKLIDLNDSERIIAEEILWNLDERGYLATDLYVIADRFNKDGTEIEFILRAVQRLEPLGIAARNIRECLLIQLEKDNESLAYDIIDAHFEDFANKRFEVIKKKMNCSGEQLAEAVNIISHLNPRPGEGTRFTKDEVVIPDLIVREQGENWVIYTNDSGLPELRISPDYVAMMEEQETKKTEAQRFLKQRIYSANWFIQAIEQRKQTLKRVMRSIIDRQPEFFSGQIHELRPMKLLDIAEDIKLDISTISRSTRGKYVDTPYGVFELKSFFSEGIELENGQMISNHIIKQALKKIVEEEDKQHPINDQRLVELLKQKGYPLSRRTVAKYREQMNVPVARLRRQL